MYRNILVLICVNLFFFATGIFAADTQTSPVNQSIVNKQPNADNKYPSVVIYTLTTCPHCMEAKQYLKEHKIPFINHEVDLDDALMSELMKIYDSMGVPENKRGVPLLIVGDKIRLQGFNKDKFEKAIKDAATQ